MGKCTWPKATNSAASCSNGCGPWEPLHTHVYQLSTRPNIAAQRQLPISQHAVTATCAARSTVAPNWLLHRPIRSAQHRAPLGTHACSTLSSKRKMPLLNEQPNSRLPAHPSCRVAAQPSTTPLLLAPSCAANSRRLLITLFSIVSTALTSISAAPNLKLRSMWYASS